VKKTSLLLRGFLLPCAFGLLLAATFAPWAADRAFAAKKSAGQVIVYNWSEYIPQAVLDDFTKETGIDVVYSTFESNEAMFAKIKLLRGKAYDVVVPSSYFVGMLARDKLIRELDRGRLPNMRNLDPKVLNQEYDPGNRYSVPYMWGALGLAYNAKYVPEGQLTRWSQLLDPAYAGKIILTDDLRDAFGLALRARAHSINSTKTEEIRDAFDFLTKLKASVRVFDVTAIKQSLISEEVWMGPIWNGDYLVALEENDQLRFIFPEEGAVLWVDSFTIPVGAENVDNAYAFINYMLRPEVAVRCIEEYKYSSPNLEAIKRLPEELRGNPILVPGTVELKNAEFIIGIGDALAEYEKYWEQVKTLR
jgi:spermidine/putrescine transport system substrate-binding protein